MAWAPTRTILGAMLGAVTMAVGAVASAVAQEPAPLRAGAVSLVVVREAAVSECPGADELRQQVEARMGAEVFVPDGPARVVVRLSERRGVHEGTISILDGDRLVGERRVQDRDCGEVVEATAVLLSLLVAPAVHDEAPPPDEAEARAEESPAAGEVGASMASPEVATTEPTIATTTAPGADDGSRGASSATDPFRLVIVAGAGVLLGWMPDASFLLRAGLGFGQRGWSVRVEARGALDGELRAQVGASQVMAATSWIGGALTGCGHLDVLALCGHIVLARSAARGVVIDAPRGDEALVMGLGASAGVGWSPWPWLRLEAEAELDVPLLVPEARVGGSPVWRATPVAGMASLGASLSVD